MLLAQQQLRLSERQPQSEERNEEMTGAEKSQDK